MTTQTTQGNALDKVNDGLAKAGINVAPIRALVAAAGAWVIANPDQAAAMIGDVHTYAGPILVAGALFVKRVKEAQATARRRS